MPHQISSIKGCHLSGVHDDTLRLRDSSTVIARFAQGGSSVPFVMWFVREKTYPLRVNIPSNAKIDGRRIERHAGMTSEDVLGADQRSKLTEDNGIRRLMRESAVFMRRDEWRYSFMEDFYALLTE